MAQPDRFRITLAQLNPTVGDIKGNAAKARDAWARGKAAGSDMVALPEMFLSGYQAQDLSIRPAFLRDIFKEIQTLAADCADGPALGIGGPVEVDGAHHNAWFVLKDGAIAARILKHELPFVKVFDEVRIFEPGPMSGPYALGPIRIGTPICEDAWHPDVSETLAETGAELLLVPNGSPYYRDKFDRRIGTMVARVIETGLPMVYLNTVGAQDDQMFDGGSFVLNAGGQLAVQLPLFDEAFAEVDFVRKPNGWEAVSGEKATAPDVWEQDYRVMVECTRDYLRKSGFSKVLLGLSGGIDSAIVATIAADAIGPENVRCVMLPSKFTSQSSLDDAAEVARNLGTRLDTIAISDGVAAIETTVAPFFEGLERDTTEENIQSRLRGLYLMALSNKFGEMLLTTGNKSEVAVGYATIYGDMSGGYNPVKDLYKTRLFETCRWRNANHRPWMMAPKGEVIPPRVIDKPPSAELRPDQRDDDSLPPYETLDAILTGLIEEEKPVADLVAEGFDRDIVKKVERLIFISEYKRFQSAPGPRLSHMAFWLDRRYPIVNRWRDEG